MTDGDILLGCPETFTADDGNVALSLDGAVVNSTSPQQWLLVYTLDSKKQGLTIVYLLFN